MSIRLLHLSDIHLGLEQKFLTQEKRELRGQEIFQSFSQIIYDCLKKNPPVDAILIAGDFFDSPFPDVHLVGRVKRILRDISEKNIPVLLIPGNHDNIISPQSVYRREKFPDTHVLLSPNINEPVELQLQGEIFHFYGMAYSFLSTQPFDQFTPLDPEVKNIALIHGSLTNQTEWQIHSQEVPLNLKNLLNSGFDYIALGHYHNFQSIQEEEISIVYPGTIEPLGWAEEEHRRITQIEFNGEKMDINTFPFPYQKRSFKTLELNLSDHAFQSMDDIADFVVKKYGSERLFFRLFLQGQTQFLIDASRLEALCHDKFFYFRVHDTAQYLATDALESLKQESTIRGLAIRKLADKMESSSDEIDKKTVQDALKILMGYFTID